MRNLLFKNLTSAEKHRRCLSLSEKVTDGGVCARSHRHIVYSVQEAQDANIVLERPTLSVVKVRDSKTNSDKLFCKMKGKVFAFHDKKIYLVTFVHTLRVELNEHVNV